MVEQAGGVGLLTRAVDAALSERPVDLPAAVALDRCAELLVLRSRFDALVSVAVADVATRELFVLDAAGSAKAWLRRQVSGEDGLLALARQLQDREVVMTALAAGEVSRRAAGQVCSALDKVPAQVDEATLVTVLVNGVQDVLGRQLGRGLPAGREPSAEQVALRAELASTVGDALNDTVSAPDVRLEPVLLLVAREVTAGVLAHQLAYLLDALLPDRLDVPPEPSKYYVDLMRVLDGDWDLRGHLDHETGLLLKAEIDRRARQREKAHAEAERQAKATQAAEGIAAAAEAAAAAAAEEAAQVVAVVDALEDEAQRQAERDAVAEAERIVAAAPRATADRDPKDEDPFGGLPRPATTDPRHDDRDDRDDRDDEDPFGGLPRAFPNRDERLTKGRLRHDDLHQALLDAASADAGSGQGAPAAMTIIATLAAVEGRVGALPGVLLTGGRPVSLSTADLQRAGCFSDLTAVLVDAAGRPVGVSSTRRSADKRERAALTAVWGAWCAVAGCARTRTVPHHVIPFSISRETVLRDLVPICDSCHHDVHDGRRRLRLKDGRHIDDHGWA